MGRVLGERMGVTPKQRACYDLRREGKTWDEIAQVMTMAPQTVRNHVRAAERNGLDPLVVGTRWPVGGGGSSSKVFSCPAAPSVVAVDGGFDLKVFLEMAQAAGVLPRVAQALARRIQGNLALVMGEMKSMTLSERVADITARADWVASHIDPVSIAGMNAKDIALTWKLLIDGAQLLGGKPTAIVDFNVRRRLEVLVPEMIAEAKRRGITLDGEFRILSQTPERTT